jgi:heme o synthase
MAAAALAPVALGQSGWLYAGSAIILNAVFLGLAYTVWRNDAVEASAMKPEKRLFAFSILYLFILFALFAADRMLVS